MLYGYGAYEMCEDPQFSIGRLSLLDRGVVFVIAHVRGGGEMGRLWYEDGKMLHKKHSFSDFVSAARHLVDSGVALPNRLVAWGGSAGRLLVGAAVNLAPELFAGVLAQVPFVDPVTTICDPRYRSPSPSGMSGEIPWKTRMFTTTSSRTRPTRTSAPPTIRAFSR